MSSAAEASEKGKDEDKKEHCKEEDTCVELALGMGVGMMQRKTIEDVGPRLKDDRAERIKELFRDSDTDCNG